MPTTYPERLSASASAIPGESLTFVCNGQIFSPDPPATLQPFSPVDYFLVSIAACLGHSCRTVMAEQRMPTAAFDVYVHARQAEQGASRLTAIQIEVQFAEPMTGADAVTVVNRARELCTVTNTLEAPVTIQVVAEV